MIEKMDNKKVDFIIGCMATNSIIAQPASLENPDDDLNPKLIKTQVV